MQLALLRSSVDKQEIGRALAAQKADKVHDNRFALFTAKGGATDGRVYVLSGHTNRDAGWDLVDRAAGGVRSLTITTTSNGEPTTLIGTVDHPVKLSRARRQLTTLGILGGSVLGLTTAWLGLFGQVASLAELASGTISTFVAAASFLGIGGGIVRAVWLDTDEKNWAGIAVKNALENPGAEAAVAGVGTPALALPKPSDAPMPLLATPVRQPVPVIAG